MENGNLWQEKGVSFDQLMENKMAKIAISPEIDKYWKALVKILDKNKSKLFPK
jgi:hypothetical protein